MNKSLLDNHPVIQELAALVPDAKYKFILVGGAVVDILEGRTPKDYDFLHNPTLVSALNEHPNWKYRGVTATAQTWQKGSTVVQVLTRKDSTGFDFTISMANYNLRTQTLEVDKNSFEHKILIPNSFTDHDLILNSLGRIPHWQKKGYTIQDFTYYSLLNGLPKKIETHFPYHS